MQTQNFKNTWWDQNLSTRMDEFLSWVGPSSAHSKVFFRNWIKQQSMTFKNCIDVGCGPATEFRGFQEDGIQLDYLGADSSTIIFQRNQEQGIPMVLCQADAVPCTDANFDLAFARHVLEHQPDYKPILDELVRVSRLCACHIFFIKPDTSEIINYSTTENLYHNTFSRPDIDRHLQNHSLVKSHEWLNINSSECMLVIWRNE